MKPIKDGGIMFIVLLAFLLCPVFIGEIKKTNAQSTARPIVPSGAVVFWPAENGAIPKGWHEYSPANGRFLVGTNGGTFTNGSAGGAETIDIQHGHSSGSLATDNDTHDHSFSDTSSTPSATFTDDRHFTGSTTYPTGNHTHGVSGTTGTDQHNHSVTSGSTGNALSPNQSIMPPFLAGTFIQKD